jgi:hypothetical protein
MLFKEAADCITEFFKDAQVKKTAAVWEKMEDDKGWKWVLVIHHLNWGDAIIIHTKFILKTDEDKLNLAKMQFSYLYDLNCKYNFVDFLDLGDLSRKLSEIITENKFGEEVKALSKFLVNPAMQLNEKLYKEDIENYTIFNFDYDPNYSIVPCKVISFDFKFDINNVNFVNLNLKKHGKDDYVYGFRLDDNFEEVSVKDLLNIEGVIISFLKKSIIQKDQKDS